MTIMRKLFKECRYDSLISTNKYEDKYRSIEFIRVGDKWEKRIEERDTNIIQWRLEVDIDTI